MLRDVILLLALFLASAEVIQNEVIQKNSVKLVGFWWKQCGLSSNPVKMVHFGLTPDPLHFPGYVNVNFNVKVGANVSAPVTLNVLLKKKTFFGWITIRCTDNIGTCRYADICSIVPYTDECPSDFIANNVPCHCPISEGHYIMNNLQFYTDPGMPEWLGRGTYGGQALIHTYGNQLGCMRFGFNVH